MKRLILIVVMVLALTGYVYGASSVTEEWKTLGNNIDVINLSWTAAADGSFTNYTILRKINSCLFYVVTNPGATAPTDNYDITLLNDDSIDVADSELLNRDTATSEDVKLTTPRCIYGDLVLTISNNSQASATGVIRLFLGR